jgi:putative pyoverdin transport system ATP-binding/permease protein
MTFFQLVRREMQGSLYRLVVMSAIAGASNSAMLAAISSGAQIATSGRPSLWTAAMFLISLFIFVKSQHYLLITATAEMEAIIHRLRLRLIERVRNCELLALEAVGRAEVISTIGQETASLKQASNTLVFTVQGVLLILFVAIYIAFLSLTAFLVTTTAVIVTGAFYHAKGRALTSGVREATSWEVRLFDRLNDFLAGSKEVRLNRGRSDDLFEDTVEISRNAANIKIRTQSETYQRMVFAQTSMYMIIAVMVFVVPALSDVPAAGVMKGTMALIFVVGAFFGLIQAIPILAAANSAADSIEQLEKRLLAGAKAPQTEPAGTVKRFAMIEMRDIEFTYLDKSSEVTFHLGPVNFTLHSGELVFIVGGNGSGKSTFLKLLAGLYEPDAGEILLDDIRVSTETLEHFRSLIAAIFSDYHLFHRLFGIRDVAPGEIDRFLKEFKLQDKTCVTDSEFSTIDLSGGQRKRLALVVSILEKRPILLLDEWTAEQDPEFRRHFYHDILPALQQAGKTVVMNTHDDRYLDELTLPARRLRMDEGRFVAQHIVENR